MSTLECNNGFCLEGIETNAALIFVAVPREIWFSNSSRKQANCLSARVLISTLYSEALLVLIQQAKHIVVDYIWYLFKFNILTNRNPWVRWEAPKRWPGVFKVNDKHLVHPAFEVANFDGLCQHLDAVGWVLDVHQERDDIGHFVWIGDLGQPVCKLCVADRMLQVNREAGHPCADWASGLTVVPFVNQVHDLRIWPLHTL